MDDSKNKQSNQHILDYLEYYINHVNPRYAVMLNGGWGIGKTFLLRKFLDSKIIPKDDFTYVSLYGLTSCGDIDDLIFTDTHKFLDGHIAKGVESISSSALSFFSIETNIGRKTFFNKFKKKLYIFDDLERCDIPINKVLGYINEFIEHKEKKVIILANENEIKNQKNYLRIREKLIGKTLTVQSSLKEALNEFTSKLSHAQARELIAFRADEITQLYLQSGMNNLRIMQQALWDLERFLSAIQDKHWEIEDVTSRCANLILLLSFSIKSGNLQEADISNRPRRLPNYLNLKKSTDKQTAFELLELKHPQIDLRDPILSNRDLSNILINGVFRPDELHHSINQSPHFSEEAESTLETLYNAFDRSEQKFNSALVIFEKEYKDRKFTDTDEILSTFSLRLWFAGKNLIEISREQALTDGKAYIDDLFQTNQLKALTQAHLNSRTYSIFNKIYKNVFDTRSLESEEFFEHFKQKSSEVEKADQKKTVESLLNDMTLNPNVYVRRISFASQNTEEHIPTSTMQQINATDFVKKLLTLKPANQSVILNAFKGRYTFTQISAAPEEPLLIAIKKELEKAAKKTGSNFEKQRIMSNISNHLEPHLKNQ